MLPTKEGGEDCVVPSVHTVSMVNITTKAVFMVNITNMHHHHCQHTVTMFTELPIRPH